MSYDVFISFKNTSPDGGLTYDRAIAEDLYYKLSDKGLKVFFSEKDLSTAAFMDEIYRALEEARMLILVSTSVEYIQSKWVRSEWQNFLGAINSGKKSNGQIITVLNGISSIDLPIEISNFQSYNSKNIDNAVDFAFRSLQKIKSLEKSQHNQNKAEPSNQDSPSQPESQTPAPSANSDIETTAAKSDTKTKQDDILNKSTKSPAKKLTKKYKIIILLIICAIFVLGIITLQFELWGCYSYQSSDNGIIITKYYGSSKTSEIPDTYFGDSVVGIGDNAFKGCDELKEIIVPDGVTTIGKQSFANCKNLTKITLPDSITIIDDYSFALCESLEELELPSGLKSIGTAAFFHCGVKSIEIPNSVTNISERAFMNSGIKTVKLPDNMTIIPDRLFHMSSLTEITLPDNLTTIGYSAFAFCDNLTKITLPDNLTTIGESAFHWCTNLTEITFPDSLTTIGDSAFSLCSNLSKITLPDGLTTIGAYAFSSCSSLSEIRIPNSVRSIGEGAFNTYEKITIIAPHAPIYYGYDIHDNITWKVI